MMITKRVGATLLHHRTSQPKRKAKLGLQSSRHNSMQNPRNYVRSDFSHHKYNGVVDKWRKWMTAENAG
jgi:hypothetical protein